MVDKENWSEEELKASVDAYKSMYQAEQEGRKIVKVKMYRDLEDRFGRSHKAFERRMQNISYVVQSLGGVYVTGLKPLSHVGGNVEPVLKRLVQDANLLSVPLPTTELRVKESEDRAAELIKEFSKSNKKPLPPRGLSVAAKYTSETTQRKRSPEVKGYVMLEANGICDLCQQTAPFMKQDGTPYLEVHHVVRLADDGPDQVDNAVAVCPNCHRALHLSTNKVALAEKLYENVGRLVRTERY